MKHMSSVKPILCVVVLALLGAAEFLPASLAETPARRDRYGDPLPPGSVARLGTIRLRASHDVDFLAVLPDGKRFVSIATKLEESDGEDDIGEQRVDVCLWRTATGELLRRFELPISGPVCAALSSNGKMFAYIFCLTLSPDGRMLAWGDTLGIVTLWDIAAGQVRRRWKAHPSFVTSLTFSADGKILASGSEDTSVLLWDVFHRPATAVREKAMKQLRRLNDRVETALRQALKDKPAAEPRRRIKILLETARTSTVSLMLRDLRAVEVLEYIGTADAREVLTTLAGGAPVLRLTREAKISLQRLARSRPAE